MKEIAAALVALAAIGAIAAIVLTGHASDQGLLLVGLFLIAATGVGGIL